LFIKNFRDTFFKKSSLSLLLKNTRHYSASYTLIPLFQLESMKEDSIFEALKFFICLKAANTNIEDYEIELNSSNMDKITSIVTTNIEKKINENKNEPYISSELLGQQVAAIKCDKKIENLKNHIAVLNFLFTSMDIKKLILDPYLDTYGKLSDVIKYYDHIFNLYTKLLKSTK